MTVKQKKAKFDIDSEKQKFRNKFIGIRAVS